MLSFQLKDNSASERTQQKKTVAVTGAAGTIGSYFCCNEGERYDLRLLVHYDAEVSDELAIAGEVRRCDILELDGLKKHLQDVDAVIHLAANPSPNATWDSLLQPNLIGSYNVFTAAKATGCRKVVYASSIHAVSGYPPLAQVKPSDPVNPGDLYGVTKCFGEAMARYMATQEDLPSICIRIGGVQPKSMPEQVDNLDMIDSFVSKRDIAQLIRRCVDDETLQFAIFHGLSKNRFVRLDISSAEELLGYAPEDDFVQLNPQLRATGLPDDVREHNTADENQKSGLRDDLEN